MLLYFNAGIVNTAREKSYFVQSEVEMKERELVNMRNAIVT